MVVKAFFTNSDENQESEYQKRYSFIPKNSLSKSKLFDKTRCQKLNLLTSSRFMPEGRFRFLILILA